MEDRAKIGNGKSSFLKSTTLPSTYDAFRTACENGTQLVDLSPNDDLIVNPGVTAVGTPLNKDNLLSSTTTAALGLTDATATPDEAITKLLQLINEMKTVRYATVTAAGWSGSAAPYTQQIVVTGMTANSNPMWDVYIPAGTAAATAAAQADACSLVNKLETSANTITLTCYDSKPAVNFQIMLKG